MINTHSSWKVDMKENVYIVANKTKCEKMKDINTANMICETSLCFFYFILDSNQRLTVLQKLNTDSYRAPFRLLVYRTVPHRIIKFIYRTVPLPHKVHGIPSRKIPSC